MKTQFGDHAFSAAAPRCWNRLPASLNAANSIDSFKTTLKTYLFSNVSTSYKLSLLLLFLLLLLLLSYQFIFWTSFSDAAMTSSGDVTSALFRQMRIVSTAFFGVSLRTVFLSSDWRKNPPRTSWNTSM